MGSFRVKQRGYTAFYSCSTCGIRIGQETGYTRKDAKGHYQEILGVRYYAQDHAEGHALECDFAIGSEYRDGYTTAVITEVEADGTVWLQEQSGGPTTPGGSTPGYVFGNGGRFQLTRAQLRSAPWRKLDRHGHYVGSGL